MSKENMSHNCCSKQKVKRGLWSPEEDEKLLNHIHNSGHGSWSSIPKMAGLERCGKSCRLRWINYLRPDLKRGSFSEQEERIIIDVHRVLGNKWAQIAKQMPGRTDNEVKNFWNSCVKKKLISQGLDPNTHNLIIPPASSDYHSNSSPLHESSANSTIPDYFFHNNPNMVWTDHDHFDDDKQYQSESQSSQYPTNNPSFFQHSYPSELDIIFENCKKWGISTTSGGSFQSSTAGSAASTEHVSVNPEQKEDESCEVRDEKGSCTLLSCNDHRGQTSMDDNASFGSCNLLNFDFVESTLVPCEMDYHLKTGMDQLAWHRK